MKKVKKFILLSLILLVPMSIAGLVLILGFWLSPQDQLQKADAIVVVSGGETKARTNEGIKLFKDGLSDYLIFSGAAEKGPISNASVMKSMAVEAGIEDVIIVTGWHKRAIEDHFDKHFELEARIPHGEKAAGGKARPVLS